MFYNILNGFCGDKLPYRMDKEKLKLFIKFVEEENPDILILNEAYFWQFAKKTNFKDFKIILNSLYNEYSTLAYTHFRWAPVIFSKFDIEKFDTSLSRYHFNYLRAYLRIKDKKLVVDIFHPHPDTSEEEKCDFIEKISFGRNNYIFSGDLNALSIEDSYDKERLVKGYESFMKSKGKPKAENMLKMIATKKILDRGLVDTYKVKNRKFDFTIPTDLMSRNKDASARIDYLFSTPDLKVIKSGIIKKPITEKISDHYPIYAILEI